MPIKNLQITLMLDSETLDNLDLLAQQENKPISLIAKELITEALKLREDMTLSAIAQIRDQEKCETVGHNDAWK